MEFSEFTIRIILLFVPGIIALKIISKLTYYKENNIFTFVIDSMLLGFCSYFTYYIFVRVMAHYHVSYTFTFIDALITKKTKLEANEILYATLAAIVVGVVFSYVINYKLIIRIAHFFRCSHKHGDIDTLHFVLNSKDNYSNWVVVRDSMNDFMYEGWLTVYSEITEKDEIFLYDVKVYKNSTAQFCYKTPGLYIPMKRDSLMIEFPLLDSVKGKKIFQCIKGHLMKFCKSLAEVLKYNKLIEKLRGSEKNG